ncbi:M23 family metallopeptidase [Salinibacterium hongtaonis]|uniref:M23 family peptidase n=1 Tax=Homoserinimonas hongtaonis TaxID=2079791 RepID=A0A2U1T2I7_9MICO|nr:M23 family metallopeptidase [Salinibacterium hongtaonis]PWB98068.1 M23 family peptidase [Salinibacterium hongtaonis]
MTRADNGSPQTASFGAAPTGAAGSVPLTRRQMREQERAGADRIAGADRMPQAPVTRSTPLVVPPVPQAIVRATTASSPLVAASAPADAATKRRRRVRVRRPQSFMRSAMSMAAMLGVGAILVSTTIPGGALMAGDSAEASQSLGALADINADVQSLGILAGAPIAEAVRDSYTAKAYVKPVPVRGSATAGNPNFSYTNNPGGSIQWPFPSPAPITYGFGPRSACSFCSTYHLGVDFTPGSGVPIQAITDGVVSKVVVSDNSLGNYVVIDHVVNGQRIQSAYAHMQWGSIQVAVGQQVTVGTIVGLVGSTGASTGAHLHLEIHADGTPIDPFAWLKANAN